MYQIDEEIVNRRGNFYFRHEESLQNTRHKGMNWGEDPFLNWTTLKCNRSQKCRAKRRDADIRVDIDMFMKLFGQALSLVS